MRGVPGGEAHRPWAASRSWSRPADASRTVLDALVRRVRLLGGDAYPVRGPAHLDPPPRLRPRQQPAHARRRRRHGPLRRGVREGSGQPHRRTRPPGPRAPAVPTGHTVRPAPSRAEPRAPRTAPPRKAAPSNSPATTGRSATPTVNSAPFARTSRTGKRSPKGVWTGPPAEWTARRRAPHRGSRTFRQLVGHPDHRPGRARPVRSARSSPARSRRPVSRAGSSTGVDGDGRPRSRYGNVYSDVTGA